MNIKLRIARRELRRMCVHYGTAVLREANGKPARIVPTLLDLLHARLRYGVGPRYYSLFEFARVPRRTWNDFVTDSPSFKKLLLQMSPADAHEIAHDKALFSRHCAEHGLPTIPILCLVCKRTEEKYQHVRCATNVEQWMTIVADAPTDLFIKPIDGTFGEGAFVATRKGSVVQFEGRSGSLQDLFAYLSETLEHEPAWLIQPRLRCHDKIASIMSRGVGTVRIVTCMDNGKGKILFALLKITVGGNAADNFHYGVTGNLLARVDLESGRLYAARGSARKDWPAMDVFTHHPETGAPIEGVTLPEWDGIVHLALTAQESLPLLKSTGWDIACTPDGPVLVEANASYSVDILQVAYGRGLKRELLQQLAGGARA